MLKDLLGRVCKAILVCLHISLCARCWIKTHFSFVVLFNFEKKANAFNVISEGKKPIQGSFLLFQVSLKDPMSERSELHWLMIIL